MACLNTSQHSQFDGAWTYVHTDNDEPHTNQMVSEIGHKHGIPSPEKDPDLPLHHINYGLD
jgi:hypothetical protein